ncbi:hypothetical protein [Xanthomarina gelatinilytica]|uniref:hypothetical protein n=1 Tax=Xanthomarina gelatinilytica TaxID=1137281 RepID=UPI003AA85971
MKHLKSLIFIFFISCFTSNALFGQNVKKEVKYINIDGEHISERKYNKCIKKGFIDNIIENEEYIVHYLSYNLYEGKLTTIEHEQIRLMIEKIVGKEIDSNRTILIHLYNKNDQQLNIDINYSRYWYQVEKSRERTIKIFDSFLIGNKDSGITPNPENHVYVDSYNFLNNTFLNNSKLDYNHISIRPDGTYKIFKGFYDILFVLDMS